MASKNMVMETSAILLWRPAIVLLGVLMLTLAPMVGPQPILAGAMSGTEAIKANDFLDSLGADTHIV